LYGMCGGFKICEDVCPPLNNLLKGKFDILEREGVEDRNGEENKGLNYQSWSGRP